MRTFTGSSFALEADSFWRALHAVPQVDAYVDALGDGAAAFEQLPDVPISKSEGSGQGLAQVPPRRV